MSALTQAVGPPVAFVLVPGAGGSAWYWHRLIAGRRAVGTTPSPWICRRTTSRPGSRRTPTPWSPPSETGRRCEWWSATRRTEARAEHAARARLTDEPDDMAAAFFHDVPADVAAEA